MKGGEEGRGGRGGGREGQEEEEEREERKRRNMRKRGRDGGTVGAGEGKGNHVVGGLCGRVLCNSTRKHVHTYTRTTSDIIVQNCVSCP